jgi:hypothetical protein
MNITRRGLMGMFAAGVAAAVLPSGVIMPVKNILTWDDFIRETSAYDLRRDAFLTRLDIATECRQLSCETFLTIDGMTGPQRDHLRAMLIQQAKRDGIRLHDLRKLDPLRI